MKQFMIYVKDGYTKALDVSEIGFDKAKAMADAKGIQVLRPNAIVAESAQDAVDKLQKASKIREAGIEQGKTVANAPAEYQRRENEIADAKQEQTDMEEAQAYGAEQSGPLGAKALVKQMGRSVPKLLTSGYEAIMNPDPELGRAQTFADRYILPYYKQPIKQAILGDPTFFPSMAIPGIGEAKAVQTGGKVAKYFPTFANMIARGEKGAKPVAGLIDAGVQSGVASLGSDQDIAGGTLVGAGLSGGLNLIGKGLQAGGKKLIESTVKPAKQYKQFDVDELMGAMKPDESGKVISPFSTLEEMERNIDNAIEGYGAIQRGAIDVGENQAQKMDNLSVLFDALALAEKDLDDKLARRKINAKEHAKALETLWTEAEMIAGPSGDFPSLVDLHNAKMSFGRKSKFDKTDPFGSDPTSRDVYRDLYGRTRDVIEGQEEVLTGSPSRYAMSSTDMAPLMAARNPVSEAVARTNKNQFFGLSPYLASIAGATAAQGPEGALIGFAPLLMNSAVSGTGAYRTGEALQRGSRYSLPLGVRLMED